MAPACEPESSGFHSHHLHPGLVEKGMKQPETVAASADARQQEIGKRPDGGEVLGPGLPPDDRLEITHDFRIGVGS